MGEDSGHHTEGHTSRPLTGRLRHSSGSTRPCSEIPPSPLTGSTRNRAVYRSTATLTGDASLPSSVAGPVSSRYLSVILVRSGQLGRTRTRTVTDTRTLFQGQAGRPAPSSPVADSTQYQMSEMNPGWLHRAQSTEHRAQSWPGGPQMGCACRACPAAAACQDGCLVGMVTLAGCRAMQRRCETIH